MEKDYSSPPSPQDSRASSPVDQDDVLSQLGPDRALRSQAPYRFHYATSRRGPPSVSEATESRHGVVEMAPRALAFGSTLNLGAFPQEWSSSRHGFNAISTVLNNPRRQPAPLRSSRFPLPSVPPADLPRVRRKDFDAYLQSVQPEWEKFSRNMQTGRDALTQSQEGVAAPLSPGSPAPGPSQHPAAWRNPPPLSAVPPVFFDPEFNLGSPRTFTSVTEQDSEYAKGSETALLPEDISLNQVLQEKLGHYMDIVEQHLVREIARRSSSFFAALSNLHDLQTEGAECLTRIGKLRAELKEVDDKQALKGLEVVRLQVRRDNLEEVMDGVKVVREIGETVGMAKHLISAGDYFEALGMIEDVEEALAPKSIGASITSPRTGPPSPRTLQPSGSASLLESSLALPSPASPASPAFSKFQRRMSHQPSPSPIDLSAIKALSTLPSQLQELSLLISSSLQTDMVGVLRVDLNTRIKQQDASSPPTTPSSEKTALVDFDDAIDLRERLTPTLQALFRVQGVPHAIKAYREAVLVEIKSAIKMHLPSSDVEDDDGSAKPVAPKPLAERNAAMARELREMALEEYLRLSKALYASLMRCIRAVALHGEVVSQILKPFIAPAASINGSFGPPMSSDTIASLTADLSDIVTAAAEAANSRASRIVAIRQEQHALLELAEFMLVFNLSWDFVQNSEVLCRKMIVGLRGTMVSQAKSFLSSFHAKRLTKSATLVENEQWAQVEVSAASQRIVAVIVDFAVSDSPELALNKATMSNGMSNGTSKAPQALAKHVRVEDRPYFVVSATVDVLELLVDYLRVMVNLQLLITDIMSRVIEFLKAFNSRTCQVVLGAGAMRSAGLKNITAKHLALASQSLSIMIALIPYVREGFRRHLNATQSVIVVEFDKLKQDYQEHQNEIHSKLIAIMGDRLTIHIKSFQAIDWEAPKPSQSVNTYMETIVKETVTLHKVLSRYLAGPVVEYVMGQVLVSIYHRLGEEYGKVELPNQDAKTRLLQDTRFLSDKLGSLRGITVPSSAPLENVVQERRVRDETSPSPLPPPPQQQSPATSAYVPRKSPFVGRRAFSGLLSRAIGETKKEEAPATITPVSGRDTKAIPTIPEEKPPSPTSEEPPPAESASVPEKTSTEDVNTTPAAETDAKVDEQLTKETPPSAELTEEVMMAEPKGHLYNGSADGVGPRENGNASPYEEKPLPQSPTKLVPPLPLPPPPQSPELEDPTPDLSSLVIGDD